MFISDICNNLNCIYNYGHETKCASVHMCGIFKCLHVHVGLGNLHWHWDFFVSSPSMMTMSFF